jgi:Predicted acetyltransferase
VKSAAIPLRVREAARGDLPAVLDLYLRSGLETGERIPLERAEAIHAQMQQHPDYRLHLFEADDRLIGTYTLLLMPNLGHQGSPSGVMEDVAVDPDWQRRGVGRAMVEDAARRCRERGCYKLVLSSNARRAGAHAFYERLGFVRHGYSFRLDLV